MVGFLYGSFENRTNKGDSRGTLSNKHIFKITGRFMKTMLARARGNLDTEFRRQAQAPLFRLDIKDCQRADTVMAGVSNLMYLLGI